MDGTITFDMDYLVHSAPQPSFLSKYLALVYPFDLVTWAVLVFSIFFVGFVLFLLGKMQKSARLLYLFSLRLMKFNLFVANSEGSLSKTNFKEWNAMYNSLWFTYGTFIGEAITRDTKSEKAYALRIVIAIWLIYCLILSQSYAGSLKAFLTSPQRSEPIDTLEQVVLNTCSCSSMLYS